MDIQETIRTALAGTVPEAKIEIRLDGSCQIDLGERPNVDAESIVKRVAGDNGCMVMGHGRFLVIVKEPQTEKVKVPM